MKLVVVGRWVGQLANRYGQISPWCAVPKQADGAKSLGPARAALGGPCRAVGG